MDMPSKPSKSTFLVCICRAGRNVYCWIQLHPAVCAADLIFASTQIFWRSQQSAAALMPSPVSFFSLPSSFSVFYPRHSIQSARQKQKRPAEHKKKSGDSAESWFHAGRLSRLRRRRSAWRHLENLLPSTAKFRSKCRAFASSWIFYFESNDNRVNCNVGSCSRRFS